MVVAQGALTYLVRGINTLAAGRCGTWSAARQQQQQYAAVWQALQYSEHHRQQAQHTVQTTTSHNICRRPLLSKLNLQHTV